MVYILNKTLVLCRTAFCKNIISGPINKNTLVRNYEHLSNRTNIRAEQKFKLKDNISDDYRLVYREQSVISSTMTMAYHLGWIGLFTSMLSIGYLSYEKPPVVDEEIEILGKKALKSLTTLERVLALFISSTMCIVLIVGSKTVPFRIYYNSKEKVYKAVFVNRIFGKKQIETFGEGTIVPILRRKSLGDVLFNINGRIALLDKECFPVQSIREQMIRKTK